MPTDFLVYGLTRPLGILFLAAVVAISLLATRLSFPEAFARLGFRRLLVAHLCVAAVALALAAYSAVSLGSEKVELGHIQDADLRAWVASNTLYMFVLIYAVALLFTSCLLVPVALWLASKGQASVSAFAGLGCAVASLVGLMSLTMPAAGLALRVDAFVSLVSTAGSGALAICVGFAVGAGLPLIKRSESAI